MLCCYYKCPELSTIPNCPLSSTVLPHCTQRLHYHYYLHWYHPPRKLEPVILHFRSQRYFLPHATFDFLAYNHRTIFVTGNPVESGASTSFAGDRGHFQPALALGRSTLKAAFSPFSNPVWVLIPIPHSLFFLLRTLLLAHCSNQSYYLHSLNQFPAPTSVHAEQRRI